MKIALIGAGNVCQALAAGFKRAGHTVIIASRDPKDAQQLAFMVGGRGATSSAAAVEEAEAIVLATPFSAFPEIAAEIADNAVGKVVVDVSNPLAGWDAEGPVFEGGRSGAEQLQELLPQSKVVKAFNAILANHQANPVVDGEPVDAFVAGDDPEARAVVLELARAIGMRGISAGKLRRARELEALGSLNMALSVHNGWQNRNAWKVLGVSAGEASPASKTAGAARS